MVENLNQNGSLGSFLVVKMGKLYGRFEGYWVRFAVVL
ncbi:hypothetical protein [Bacillus phage Sarmo]|nr:hypothetical protein [Bacillus phage Sarmo]